jgi:N-methylhydantoinase A/oxoprolinase/acetone carboxylase beta subunit
MLARPAVRAAIGSGPAGGLPLICYGGGGGCLLPAVAARAGLGPLYLPALSPVFSAFGVSTFDVEHRYEARTVVGKLAEGVADAGLADAVAALVAAARRDARGEGFDPGQAEMSVSVLRDDGTVLAEETEPGQVAAAVRQIGLAADQPVLVRLRATCAVRKPSLPRLAGDGPEPPGAQTGQRAVLLPGGWREVPVYARDRLPAGHALTGPCLLESSGTTCLIPAGMTGLIDQFGTAVLAAGA